MRSSSIGGKLASVFRSKSKSPEIGNDCQANANTSISSRYQEAMEEDSDSEPPLTPIELHGYKDTTQHKLLSTELAEELRAHVPSILQISHNWTLLYSMEQNGTSLNTLYSCSAPTKDKNVSKRRGYFLIIRDSNHDVFGAYLNDYLRPVDNRRYYGNGDCFLWKSEIAKVKHITRAPEFEDADTHIRRTSTVTEDDDEQYWVR
ncbi:unnamed protein product [Ambrosiozyma monospora]|uniref:Oxidation resistance protein 1 n=1 Tax=Ambrosiozyma monospora TaxID=43982 RepID=A0A9W6Z197_AMBMO|nr:unnamed protein product [Ambrosiozyma monospora]